jgi:hypothetical protein
MERKVYIDNLLLPFQPAFSHWHKIPPLQNPRLAARRMEDRTRPADLALQHALRLGANAALPAMELPGRAANDQLDAALHLFYAEALRIELARIR